MSAMDLKISGSGTISAGEYNNIHVSGSGNINGLIRCANISCSGSLGGDAEIIAAGDVSCSGSVRITKGFTVKDVSTSGSLHCGYVKAEGEVKTSGSLHCGGDVKCTIFKASGSAYVDGGIEADKIYIAGKINCGGLMNAETIEIKEGCGTVESIGCGTIVITQKDKKNKTIRLPLFNKLARSAGSNGVTVVNSIEGDTIAVEGVKTPKVVGRAVAIGEGCDIDLVQYSEEIEINENAKVGRYEKI